MLPQVPLSVTPATTKTHVNISRSNFIPNLSAWTFRAPSSFPTVHASVPQPVRGQVTFRSTTAPPTLTTKGIFTPVVLIQSRGTTFYCNCLTTTLPTTTLPFQQSTTTPVNVPIPTFPITVLIPVSPSPPNTFTVPDLAQRLTAAKKAYLPEWKLEQYNGNTLQWHQWIGQFKSAFDSDHSQKKWSSRTWKRL